MSIFKIVFWVYAKLPKKLCYFLSDESELKRLYYRYYGYFPDLNKPRTIDEKIQWLKLYYRDSLMSNLADKFEVRNYLIKLNLEHILNDIYGVYENVEEIDINKLPEQFVLKTTHGCSMNILCKDKTTLDWGKAKKQLKKWLKVNYYHRGRQWVYKDIKPRIICEKYLESESEALVDYKIYCFNGKPSAIDIYSGRNSKDGIKYDAYDLSWNFLARGDSIPGYNSNMNFDVKKIDQKILNNLLVIAGKLAKILLFARVDFYIVDSKIIFGEITFYPGNGLSYVNYPERDKYLGSLFKLPH